MGLGLFFVMYLQELIQIWRNKENLVLFRNLGILVLVVDLFYYLLNLLKLMVCVFIEKVVGSLMFVCCIRAAFYEKALSFFLSVYFLLLDALINC